tara:strand:- start:713 stop:919 length:207 start_codon:yes stop_codon:yes gene_type:complete
LNPARLPIPPHPLRFGNRKLARLLKLLNYMAQNFGARLAGNRSHLHALVNKRVGDNGEDDNIINDCAE